MNLISVKNANYIKDYSIAITFSNGIKKIINLEKELWGEIFEPLNDNFFF